MSKPILIGPKADANAFEKGTVITGDGKNYYLDPDLELAGGHFISVEADDGLTWDSFHVGLGRPVYTYLRAEDIEPDAAPLICPECGASIIPPLRRQAGR